jgi:hypothetical protein
VHKSVKNEKISDLQDFFSDLQDCLFDIPLHLRRKYPLRNDGFSE